MPAMEEALSFEAPDGFSVSAILTRPPDRTEQIAVLCHGFLSGKNSTTNKTLTRHLVEQGIATFRFDFFGHGDSKGPFERITVTKAIEQALAALKLVSSRGYRRIGLVGSSFGGLVAILAAAKWHAPVSSERNSSGGSARGLACLALKCPVVDFPEELELELGPAGMEEWRNTDTVPDFAGGPNGIKLSYGFYEDCRRHIAYDAAPAIPAPTLIVQGDQDELIPLHQSRQFYDALQHEKSLQILPGADHQFTKAEHFRTMTALLTEWLTTHLLDTRHSHSAP